MPPVPRGALPVLALAVVRDPVGVDGALAQLPERAGDAQLRTPVLAAIVFERFAERARPRLQVRDPLARAGAAEARRHLLQGVRAPTDHVVGQVVAAHALRSRGKGERTDYPEQRADQVAPGGKHRFRRRRALAALVVERHLPPLQAQRLRGTRRTGTAHRAGRVRDQPMGARRALPQVDRPQHATEVGSDAGQQPGDLGRGQQARCLRGHGGALQRCARRAAAGMACRQLMERPALAQTVLQTAHTAGPLRMEQRTQPRLDAERTHQQPAAVRSPRGRVEGR